MVHYTLIDREVEPILRELTTRGVPLQVSLLDECLNRKKAEFASVTEAINREVGHSFNIRSTAQIKELLRELLGVPETDLLNSQMEEYAESSPFPVLKAIVRGRHLDKEIHTLKLFSDHTYSHTHLGEGYVHPEYAIDPKLGRIMSRHPNITSVREDNRSFFGATGKKIIELGFRQNDLRIAQYLSRDGQLAIDLDRQGGIFDWIASLLMYAHSISGDPTPEALTLAKKILYSFLCFRPRGVPYPFLERVLQGYNVTQKWDIPVTLDSVHWFIEDRYPRLYTYLSYLYEEGERKSAAVIQSLYGRALDTETQLNRPYFPIAATSADLGKLLLIQVEGDERLRELGVVAISSAFEGVLLTMPVDGDEDLARGLLTEIAEGVEPEMRMKARVEIGESWGSAR